MEPVKRPRRTIFYKNKLQMPKWYCVLLGFASIFDAITFIVTFGYVGSSAYLNLFSRGIFKYVVPANKKAMENEK